MIQIDRLIRSNRRSLALELNTEGALIVRAPKRMAKREIVRFVEEKAEWIAQKRALLASRPQAQIHSFKAGERFLYLGLAYRLTYRQGLRAISLEEGTLCLPQGWREQAEEQIIRWYQQRARDYFSKRLQKLAEEAGFRYTGLRVTSAQTRWGSCSAKNGINLTWYLIMAPPRVIDSVLIHELCHTVEHNHSAAFWDLVYRCMPDYDACHGWLRENRQLLRLTVAEEARGANVQLDPSE